MRTLTTSQPRLDSSNINDETSPRRGRSEEEVAADWLLTVVKTGAGKLQNMSEAEEKIARNLLVKKINKERNHKEEKSAVESLGKPFMFYVFVFVMFNTYYKHRQNEEETVESVRSEEARNRLDELVAKRVLEEFEDRRDGK